MLALFLKSPSVYTAYHLSSNKTTPHPSRQLVPRLKLMFRSKLKEVGVKQYLNKEWRLWR